MSPIVNKGNPISNDVTYLYGAGLRLQRETGQLCTCQACTHWAPSQPRRPALTVGQRIEHEAFWHLFSTERADMLAERPAGWLLDALYNRHALRREHERAEGER